MKVWWNIYKVSINLSVPQIHLYSSCICFLLRQQRRKIFTFCHLSLVRPQHTTTLSEYNAQNKINRINASSKVVWLDVKQTNNDLDWQHDFYMICNFRRASVDLRCYSERRSNRLVITSYQHFNQTSKLNTFLLPMTCLCMIGHDRDTNTVN